MIKTHCRSSRFMLTARCKFVFVLILLFPFQTPIILKCDFTGSISPSTLLNSHDHGSGYAARTSHELECVEKIALNQSANVSKIQTQTVSYARREMNDVTNTFVTDFFLPQVCLLYALPRHFSFRFFPGQSYHRAQEGRRSPTIHTLLRPWCET